MRPGISAGSALLFALATTIPPAFAGQVFVVGSAPGQFALIQDAVTLAQDGDVVILKSGAYGTVRILDKTIALVVDNNATVTQSGAVRVRSLSPGKTVVLAGLKVTGTPSTALPELLSGLYAESCTGRILSQDCEFRGASSVGPCIPYQPRGGADLTACAGVAFVRCTLVGCIGSWTLSFPSPEGPGLSARTSAVSFDHGTAQGGVGGTVCSGYEDGASAGHGAELRQSVLYASHATFRGPNGIPAPFPPTILLSQVSGTGGCGIVDATPGLSALRRFELTLLPGLGGGCSTFTCVPGSNGVTLRDFAPGAVTTVPGIAPALSGPRLVRDTETAQFQIDAQPLDRVEIAVSRGSTFANDLGTQSVLHVQDPQWLPAGIVPPTASRVTRRFRMPDVPVSNPGHVFVLQARVTSPSGTQRLTNAHVVVLVDATY